MRYSMRTLFLWFTVISITFGTFVLLVKRIGKTNQLISRVEELNGSVGVDGDFISGPARISFTLGGLPPLITDKEMENLASLLSSCSGIRSIGLTNSSITDLSIQYIADSCNSLREIELSGTKVTDLSLKELSKCPQLATISVPVAVLTDAGIQAIKELHHLGNIHVYGALTSDPRTEALELARPDLKIETYERSQLW